MVSQSFVGYSPSEMFLVLFFETESNVIQSQVPHEYKYRKSKFSHKAYIP